MTTLKDTLKVLLHNQRGKQNDDFITLVPLLMLLKLASLSYVLALDLSQALILRNKYERREIDLGGERLRSTSTHTT